jgi:hypothetical protein
MMLIRPTLQIPRCGGSVDFLFVFARQQVGWHKEERQENENKHAGSLTLKP